MKNENPGGVSVGGKVRLQVMSQDGKVQQDFPWQSNLILDQGMSGIANSRTWADSFLYAVAGNGSTVSSSYPTSVRPVATASQTGTTVTASSGVLSAGDVGSLIRWDTGEDGKILSYDGTSGGTRVTVDRTATVPAGAFTLYRVGQTGLLAEVKRTGTYVGGAGNCGTSVVPNNPNQGQSVLTLLRTFDFTSEGSTVNYTEVGLSWASGAGSNLFSRVTLATPVSVPSGSFLRLSYALSLVLAPAYLNAAQIPSGEFLAGVGIGKQNMQLLGFKVIDVASGTSIYNGSNVGGCLEPCDNGTGVVYLSTQAVPPMNFTLDVNRRVGNSVAFLGLGGNIGAIQTGGTFVVARNFQFGTGVAINAGWRCICLGMANGGVLPGDQTCLVHVFDSPQAKTGFRVWNFAFRWVWTRSFN